jgi:hypothetical protein
MKVKISLSLLLWAGLSANVFASMDDPNAKAKDTIRRCCFGLSLPRPTYDLVEFPLPDGQMSGDVSAADRFDTPLKNDGISGNLSCPCLPLSDSSSMESIAVEEKGMSKSVSFPCCPSHFSVRKFRPKDRGILFNGKRFFFKDSVRNGIIKVLTGKQELDIDVMENLTLTREDFDNITTNGQQLASCVQIRGHVLKLNPTEILVLINQLGIHFGLSEDEIVDWMRSQGLFHEATDPNQTNPWLQ